MPDENVDPIENDEVENVEVEPETPETDPEPRKHPEPIDETNHNEVPF